MDELFQNILTASFHGSLVILAILLLRPILKKGPKKFLCMLWLLAFIRLILPFELESSLSLQPKVLPIPETKQEEVAPLPYAENPELVSDSEGADILWEDNQAPEFQISAPERAQDKMSGALPPVKESVSPLTVFSIVWLSVSSLFLVFSILSYTHLRLSVRDAIRTKDAWESERIETAFILGFIRPRIYIPMGMNPIVRKYILAHERTHLEKGDQWLKLFGYLTLAIHWFNPLVWAAYILLCKDIELACDERVVQFMDLSERKAYSSALLACSANRIHLAACPVAFGEVSVKERIKAVLHYKKPAFWVSLICVIAIVFVAVCLMTNPQKDSEDPEVIPAMTEETVTTEPTETKPASQDGPMLGLKESEIQYTCQQAIERLKAQDSNYLFTEYNQNDEKVEFDPDVHQTEVRRFGNDIMKLDVPDKEGFRNGILQYGEKSAMFNGGYWLLDQEFSGLNSKETLDHFSPNGVMVTFPEGTGVIDGHTLSFQAQWVSRFADLDHPSTGIFTYEFEDDGSLKKVTKDYSFKREDETKVTVYESMTVMVEDPEISKAEIQKAADSAITWEEFDILRIQADQVTEIPSNKTDFDKNFMMGSGQMGWNFQNGGWYMKVGAVNPTETGLDLAYEFAGAFGENEKFRVGGNAVTDSTFYLETMKDGKWEKYPLAKEGKNTMNPQKIASGKRFHVDWSDSYGTLPGGFYRIGMYYTLTTDKGDTEKQFCYTKFRLYDQEQKNLMNTCNAALQALLNQDSYHLKTSSMYLFDLARDDAHYRLEESWKSGSTTVCVDTSYAYKGNTPMGTGGVMRKDGVGYTLTFENDSINGTVTLQNANFVDQDSVTFWTNDFTIYDAQVYDIIREGNTIRVLSTYDFNDDYDHTEIIFYLDGGGNLTKMQHMMVDHQGKNHIENELTVISDSPEQIEARIKSLSSGKTPAFSYAEDMEEIENLDTGVRTKNFVNSAPGAMGDSLTIIARAKKDCTLPAVMDMEPGTNVAEVFYDADADMWKVEFTASWDSTIYEAVYLDNQGITKMTVQKELPVDY